MKLEGRMQPLKYIITTTFTKYCPCLFKEGARELHGKRNYFHAPKVLLQSFSRKRPKVIVWANVIQHFPIKAFCLIDRNLFQCSLGEKNPLCCHKLFHHKCNFVLVWNLCFFQRYQVFIGIRCLAFSGLQLSTVQNLFSFLTQMVVAISTR